MSELVNKNLVGPGEVEQGYHNTVVEGLVNRNNELREERANLRGEVERLRILLEGERVTSEAWRKENDVLRTHLAEVHVLLRDIAKAQDEEGWWVSSENGPDYWECPACYATSIAVRKNGQIVGGDKGEIKHEWDCWIQRCAAVSNSAESSAPKCGHAACLGEPQPPRG